ncbi:EAL domain-containing protein [Mitsuaria sp. WAJ17]|uniref:putative bifunctional diguanylate cyclase/phosphodiesterase n=1 Tax=Mitsuaria sp. WAJ17 TaxID=2761452 RepID=UPI0016020151|nr:EAL domain-containing protein [Mitsuaria sp. WAJ17]MBB2484753.1 EAL domain-containing protein [Mitsuaria sp. WAJ17]
MQLPAFLNPRRIEGRIVALFLGLLLLVQLASYGFIGHSIEANAEAAIEAKLATAGRMLQRLMVQQAAREQAAAELLAADYGFRQALGGSQASAEQADVETLRDALNNNGERVNAALVAYADVTGQLVAATREEAQVYLPLLKRQNPDPEQATLVLVDREIMQVVTVPVRAPMTIGHVLMGFRLDEVPLLDLKRLINVDAMFVTGERGRWQESVSVVEDSERGPAFTSAMAELSPNQSVRREWGGQHWRVRLLPLPQELAGRRQIGAVMWASFDEAVAPYRQLQWSLLALTAAGIAAFAMGSVFTARRISRPIASLTQSAQRLGAGDYDTPVASGSDLGEVAELARSFEAMRLGIREREEQVYRLAYWDPLTGLPNREQFSQRLQERLQASEAPCAVLMLDLDRFKHVNDVLGHRLGDQLLCGVGARLAELCRGSQSLLARLGGDEFALLLEGADEEAALAMADRIQRDFEQSLHIEDQTVDLGAGIGIVLYPRQAREASSLLSRAELAMYAAKQRQSGSQLYSPDLDAGSQESLSLLGELRRAVEGGQLRLFLQPKVELRSGQVISAEALVRWEHPQRGLVPPMQFIPFAEQTGFIRQLSAWVVAASARACRLAREQGQVLRISVNLSTRDLMDQDLPLKIRAAIEAEGVPPSALCLEITESAIMDDPARALSTLEQLSAMGFKLSIDDFGTGYSSLAYLKRLPVDELKIDKSFVMAMERDLDDAKIVRSTIELAHNLGLSVVAEGLETLRAWQILARLGCDEGQGYFISKPMPESQFVDWLAQWSPPALDAEDPPESLFAGLS